MDRGLDVFEVISGETSGIIFQCVFVLKKKDNIGMLQWIEITICSECDVNMNAHGKYIRLFCDS